MPAAATRRSGPVLADLSRAEPFASAEEAWFWTMAALAARNAGARIVSGQGLKVRPCEPDDVIRCLDRLYRQRRIEIAHLRVLRRFGDLQRAPDPHHPADRTALVLWREAMSRLEWPLKMKGIVA